MDVREAAAALGIDASRVRQLLRSGRLPGERQAGRWLVDEAALARLRAQATPAGRPLAPARAWGLLDLLDGGEARWLSPSERSQVRSLLRRAAAAGSVRAEPGRWRARLASRARLHDLVGHPAAVRRLLEDPRVMPAGVSAAAAAGADLVAVSGIPEVYLEAAAFAELQDRLRLRRPQGRELPDVRVRVPQGPFPVRGGGIGRAVLAADLLEELEPRAAAAGVDLLARAVEDYAAAHPGPRRRPERADG